MRSGIVEKLKDVCSDLTGQSVDAAHYLINNSNDVAFHSMREIARRANVPPVSLVRVAQRLGLPGYRELRDQFVVEIQEGLERDRGSIQRNQRKAEDLIGRSGQGTEDFVRSFFDAEQTVVQQAHTHLSIEALEEAVTLLIRAPKVFVIGLRTAFAPAFTLAYSLRKARANVVLIEGMGGAPESFLDDLNAGDAFVAVTFAPFNRTVYNLAKRASGSGARVIAITDSFAAPAQKFAGRLHFVAPTSSQSFPESTLGAIAITHLMAAMTVAHIGQPARDRIIENERYLVGSGEYVISPKRKA